jgi:hypothetical protein
MDDSVYITKLTTLASHKYILPGTVFCTSYPAAILSVPSYLCEYMLLVII